MHEEDFNLTIDSFKAAPKIEQMNTTLRMNTFSEQQLYHMSRTQKESRLNDIMRGIINLYAKLQLLKLSFDFTKIRVLTDAHLNELLTYSNWTHDATHHDIKDFADQLQKASDYMKQDEYLPIDENEMLTFKRTLDKYTMTPEKLQQTDHETKADNLILIADAARDAASTSGHQTLSGDELLYIREHAEQMSDKRLDDLLNKRLVWTDHLLNATVNPSTPEAIMAQRKDMRDLLVAIYSGAKNGVEQPTPDPYKNKTDHVLQSIKNKQRDHEKSHNHEHKTNDPHRSHTKPKHKTKQHSDDLDP